MNNNNYTKNKIIFNKIISSKYKIKKDMNEEVTKESSTYINNIIKINKLKNNKTVSSKKKI